MSSKAFLSTEGNKIINKSGEPIILRGFGLGGWMNMENFITGFPGNEEAHRTALKPVLGEENYELFFDRFLDYFFTEADAEFIKSLSLNLLRLPVNYRHFEDDMAPFEIKEEGFKHLDHVIDICAEHGIYTIIDLHALPGCQNQDWHSDNATHQAMFWRHKHFQDRVVHLWEVFAERYKDNPWVAGYNPINEPADPSEQKIEPYYHRLVNSIRVIDPDHIIFLEGNRFSRDFHMFGKPLSNVVYTNHHYPLPGFIDGGPYPGESRGEYFDKDVVKAHWLERSQYMLDNNLPIWTGEFGPVYLGEPEINALRYQLLRDQLDLFTEYQVNWAIWTYKDIGLQGVVYANPESPWMKRIQPVLEKKLRLGADSWGGLDINIRHILQPIEELFTKEFPDFDPFPFGTQWQINRLVRNILLSEPLISEFAELFTNMSETEIDELMASFKFENCVQRTELANTLSDYGNR